MSRRQGCLLSSTNPGHIGLERNCSLTRLLLFRHCQDDSNTLEEKMRLSPDVLKVDDGVGRLWSDYVAKRYIALKAEHAGSERGNALEVAARDACSLWQERVLQASRDKDPSDLD